MKINFDVKKVHKLLKMHYKKQAKQARLHCRKPKKRARKQLMQSTTEVVKNASNALQEKAKEISEHNKNEAYLRRLKKYNPLFSDKYFSEDFNFPSMVMITDDSERKEIDVCQGAIGWLYDEADMDLLCLYDTFANKSGLVFVPSVDLDAIYFADRFDSKRFIRIDCIFSKAHEERLAELKHIAYSLGAKRCSIEISESDAEVAIEKKDVQGNAKVLKGKFSQETSDKKYNKRSGVIEIEFEESNKISNPKLKWFANDDIIRNLVAMRLNKTNTIKSERLVLEGSVSATMSIKTAYSIDCAVKKIKAGVKAEFESQAMKECSSKLIFDVEF